MFKSDQKFYRRYFLGAFALGGLVSFDLYGTKGYALASSLPDSIDAGRVQTQDYLPPSPEKKRDIGSVGKGASLFVPPPEGAEDIPFVLNKIAIEGGTVYSPQELEDLYRADVGKAVPLSRLWEIANAITQKYRDDGYFLSRAYIPEQEIADTPRIAIVEGYISETNIDPKWEGVSFIVGELDDLRSKKPARLSDIEQMLLRLNQLPGVRFSGVLGSSERSPMGDGGVSLSIQDGEIPGIAVGAVSNFGSKYMGPVVAGFSWEGALIPLQRTQIGLSLSADHREVKSGNVSQEIPVTLQDKISFSLDHSISNPGDTLTVQEIESVSTSVSASWEHNWAERRDFHLSSKSRLISRHSTGYISDTLLSRDDIRTFSLDQHMSGVYSIGTYSAILGLTKGLPFLGGSKKYDPDLSRLRSGNDFQKMTIDFQTGIPLSQYWHMSLRAQGQYASRSLPSSEEFGFGGSSMGRGYDSSEITGDHGVSSSVEVSYLNLFSSTPFLSLRPYAFYDFGKVWNFNQGQATNLSAASGGFGITGSSKNYGPIGEGWQVNTFVAKPLTKAIDSPHQGGSDSLQFRFQLSKEF